MEQKDQIEIFKLLDNKMAYVRSGNLSIGGHHGDRLYLKFTKYGIECYSELKYNDSDIHKKLKSNIYANNKISYNERDLILENITHIDNLYVKVANISFYDVKDIRVEFDKNTINSMEIKYNNGSLITITCINILKEILDKIKEII